MGHNGLLADIDFKLLIFVRFDPPFKLLASFMKFLFNLQNLGA